MLLKLTKKQKNCVKVTYHLNRFVANIGKTDPVLREYYSVGNMMKEFYENGIKKAEFDDKALFMYEQGGEFIINNNHDQTLN